MPLPLLPPVARLRLMLNTICMAHSVMVITKGVNPRDTMSIILSIFNLMSSTRKWNRLFSVKKNNIIHTQEQNCEITVARLEPLTPILRVNMNIGSRTIFITAPRSTEPMAIKEYPWVWINGLSPCASITNMVPALSVGYI